MPCDAPITIQLEQPIKVIDPDTGEVQGCFSIPVPCGICAKCINTKRNQWAFRMKQEMYMAQSAYFATLTYAIKPLSKRGHPTLDKKDMARFWKRLRHFENRRTYLGMEDLKRRNIGLPPMNRKLKYYYCGEYGKQFGRPHYHAIIFNAKEKNIHDAWSDHKNEKTGAVNGHVYLDNVSPASIFYTLKYMDKGATKYKKGFDGQKEYSMMSKGLGLCYLFNDDGTSTEHHRWLLRHDDMNRVYDQEGNEIPIPRYYSRKLYDHLKIYDSNGKWTGYYEYEKGIIQDNRTIATSKSIINHENETLLEAWKRGISIYKMKELDHERTENNLRNKRKVQSEKDIF